MYIRVCLIVEGTPFLVDSTGEDRPILPVTLLGNGDSSASSVPGDHDLSKSGSRVGSFFQGTHATPLWSG